ncbi:MAG: DUF5661 family protein [bacterium]
MENYTNSINSNIDNILTGGSGDYKSLEQIANKHDISINNIKNQLKIGIGVEMEHTNDYRIAKEIAIDHLLEIPDYYSRLEKMERDYNDTQNLSDKPLTEEMKSLSGLALKHVKEEELFILYNMDIYKNVLNADYAISKIMGVIQYRYNNKYSAYEIDKVGANKGYGPQLYMILMSYAGDKGVIPSRVKGEISDEAKKVWKEFYNGVGSKYVEIYDLKNNQDELANHHEEDYLNKKYVIKRKININSLLSKDNPYEEYNDAILDYSLTFLFNKITRAYKDKINDEYIPSFIDNKIEIEDNERNIGFFVIDDKLSPNQKNLYISEIMINPKYKELKYFRILMDHIISFAKVHDYERIILEPKITFKGKYNEFLLKLYKTYNFIELPNNPSQLAKEISENILFEDYPTNFDMEYFKSLPSFNKRIQYANEKLRKIGTGSGRIVYQIDDDKVLKLAKNKKGIAQNEVEYSLGNDYYFNDITAEVYDADEDNYSWIEMKLAKKLTPNRFKHLVGIDFNTYKDLLKRYIQNIIKPNKYYNLDPLTKDQLEIIENNEFISNIIDVFSNYDNLEFGDFYRLSSYGEVDNNVVLVDYGLNDEVYSSHYLKEEELSDIKTKENNFNFSNIDKNKLKKSVQYIEKLPSKIKGNISLLYRFYVINAQNIKNAIEIANNAVKYYNNLLRLQNHLRNIGLLKENHENMENHIYEYGCLMVKFIIPEWKDILWQIDLDDLYTEEEGYGLEKEPHITILYGFHDKNSNLHNKIFKLFEKVNDYIEANVTKIDKFSNEKFDVLKLNIESPRLRELNKYFKENYEYTNKFEEYKPHMTIGYFKKGHADKYIKDLKKPIKIKSKLLFYSNPEKEKFYYAIGKGIIDERKISYMPGSSIVSVKDKCKLGGLPDGTSVACNQGDINALNIKPINEIDNEKKMRLDRSGYDWGIIKDKKGKEFFVVKDKIIDLFRVFDNNKPIGHLYLDYDSENKVYVPDAGKSDATFIEPEYRGNGLAVSLYKYVMNKGYNIKPSNLQSKEIKRVWSKLNEVGEGTAKPFKYKNTKFSEKKSEYKFITEKEKLEYRVIIEETYDEGQLGIYFDVYDTERGGYHSRTVDEGNPYKIMATVIKITEEDLEKRKNQFKQNIKELSFFPINEDIENDKDDRREKFYISYIERLKPNWKVTKNDLGIIIVKIKNELDEDYSDLFKVARNKKLNLTGLADKIAQKLGYEKAEPYGHGSAGGAYYIGNNKIMKITTDVAEAHDLSKLMGKNYKHLPKIYNIFKLKTHITDVYVIIREELDVNPNKVDDMFYQLNRELKKHNLPSIYKIMEDYTVHGFKEENIDYLETTHAKIKDNKIKKDIEQIIELLRELKQANIRSYDFQVENFGYRKDGSLVFYDIGYSRHYKKESPEEIDI